MSAPDILFVTRKWAPAVGGMETWSHRLSEELAKSASIEVVALPGRSNGHPPGLVALAGFPFTVLRRFLARRRKPDVLHLGDMALWPLGLIAAGRGTRVVLSAHGTDVSYPLRRGWRGRLYGAYLRLGARLLRGALVTANSPATAAAAKAAGWRDITVVPLATDLAGMVPGAPPASHLLFVGRLVPLKGCGWFIREVLPLLPDGVDLHVAGTAIDPAEAALLDHPRVHYLGTLHGEDLAAAYRNAQCVVVPNIRPATGQFEGFGLVATEAAAAGGVVLAADCGGLPSAVRDGVTGFLVPCQDAPAWADAIAGIQAWTAARRKDFIAGSLAEVDRSYRWPRVAAETLAAYRRLLKD